MRNPSRQLAKNLRPIITMRMCSTLQNIAEQTMLNLGFKPGLLLNKSKKENADNDPIDFQVETQLDV